LLGGLRSVRSLSPLTAHDPAKRKTAGPLSVRLRFEVGVKPGLPNDGHTSPDTGNSAAVRVNHAKLHIGVIHYRYPSPALRSVHNASPSGWLNAALSCHNCKHNTIPMVPCQSAQRTA